MLIGTNKYGLYTNSNFTSHNWMKLHFHISSTLTNRHRTVFNHHLAVYYLKKLNNTRKSVLQKESTHALSKVTLLQG